LLGLVADRYAVAERYGELLLVDLFTARERLLMVQLPDLKSTSQPLLIPETVSVPRDTAEQVEHWQPQLAELGIQVDRRDQDSIVFRQLPPFLAELPVDALARQLAEQLPHGLNDNGDVDRLMQHLVKAAATSPPTSLTSKSLERVLTDLAAVDNGIAAAVLPLDALQLARLFSDT